MQTKTFSVKDGTLLIQDGDIELLSENDIMLGINMVLATTNEQLSEKWNLHLLPSTLIRKPNTDEELAEDKYPYLPFQIGINPKDGKPIIGDFNLEHRQCFLAGRKSVGGEFHLTREELKNVIYKSIVYGIEAGYEDDRKEFVNNIISSLTPTIYPTTITVEHDGEKYYWETLKWEY